MKLKTFLLITSLFFLLIGVLHLLRILLNWDLIIGNYSLPVWMSVVAFFALFFLSFVAFRYRKGLS